MAIRGGAHADFGAVLGGGKSAESDRGSVRGVHLIQAVHLGRGMTAKVSYVNLFVPIGTNGDGRTPRRGKRSRARPRTIIPAPNSNSDAGSGTSLISD